MSVDASALPAYDAVAQLYDRALPIVTINRGGSGPGDRRDAPIRSSASRRAPPIRSPAGRREASRAVRRPPAISGSPHATNNQPPNVWCDSPRGSHRAHKGR